MLAGGGLLLLPACRNSEGAVSVTLKNISVTAKAEALLAEVAEAILPKTDTPGAKALNLHQFVLLMVDDCCSKTEQLDFTMGLKSFDAFSTKMAGRNFAALNGNEKLSLLRSINSTGTVGSELKTFLSITRKFVVRGYETSEYFLTELVPYQMTPGHFSGCVPVNKAV